MTSSKQPSTTTQIQKTELPAWVEGASQENFALAKQLSMTPYQSYDAPRIAQESADEQGARANLHSGYGQSGSALQTALDAARSAQGYTPTQVSSTSVQMPNAAKDVAAQGFLSRNINEYMNPFTQNVVDTTLAGYDRNATSQAQSVSDASRGSGAWGGSRFGVQSAVLQAEQGRERAGVESGLRSAAYTDAAGRIMTDNQSALQAALANQNSALTTEAQSLSARQGNQSSALQAALANQNANQNAAQLKLSGGQLALGTGAQIAQNTNQYSLLQNQYGQQQKAREQAVLDLAYDTEQERRNYPTEQLNLRMAALGMSPYGKSSTSTSTGTQGGSSNGLLTGLGTAATILPLLFSDRRVKKNVKKKGKVPGTDLNAYEFQYRKDFAGGDTPKQIGLMAQEVERKSPNAVKNVKGPNGKTVKAVDYPLAILEGHERKSRNDKGKVRAPYRPRTGVRAA